jgi:hypothetical protein
MRLRIVAKNPDKLKNPSSEKLICARCEKRITDDLWESIDMEDGTWANVHLAACTDEEIEAELLAESRDNN